MQQLKNSFLKHYILESKLQFSFPRLLCCRIGTRYKVGKLKSVNQTKTRRLQKQK